MSITNSKNAQQKTRQFTARDKRIKQLEHHRWGLATYVRFCETRNDIVKREAKRRTFLSDRLEHVSQGYADAVTQEVVSAVTRVVVEIGLLRDPIDPSACLDSLREVLGQHVDSRIFDDVLAHANSLMDRERSRLLEKCERSGRAHALKYPRLIEPEHIANVVNLTTWRNDTIWHNKFRIKAIDAQPKSDGYYKNWTKEQHREHRELAKKFNCTPDTIANWRRKGEEAFAARVAEKEAILLTDDMIAHHRLPGEHPFDTCKRLRREWKKEEKEAAKQKAQTVTAKVKLKAAREGVSERTGWRRKAQAMSRFGSADVTLVSENEPVFRGFASGEPRNHDLRVSRSRVEVRDVRLSKKERSKLKEWYERKTGRTLTDAAIRKRRERGKLTPLILEMRADREAAAMAEVARAEAEKDEAAKAEATPVIQDAAFWEECERLADMFGPAPEPTALLLAA
jgi:hypothetical protein